MASFRPILLVCGILITVLSAGMLIPGILDLFLDNEDWMNFFLSSFISGFVGISLILTNQSQVTNLTIRQAFILTSASWVALTTFSAIPFMLSEMKLSFTDAFFEAMSGITTTGATVLSDLQSLPPGILLWRSLLQWMGGIGIIVLAMAVLPMLRIGGMQLFRTESSDKTDKALPRAAQVSLAIGNIYLFLTALCCICYWMAGMGLFDAFGHAMTTVATAGFSHYDNSIGHFNNPSIEYIAMLFMILSGIPFVIYVQMMRGRPKAIYKDSQVRAFIVILFIAIAALTLWRHIEHNISLEESFRYVSFNVTSVMTTTGYSSADYSSWGSFAITLLFLLSVVGGCTGSTTGGIKIFRYQMLYQTAKAQIQHLIQPNAIVRPRFNNKPVSETITQSVMGFIILFAFCFLVLAVVLAFCGLDYLTSMSAAAATLSNLGPGLGPVVGPAGNYASLPDLAKWVLSFAMLVGRLEIFTILVLFSTAFWRD